MLVRFSVVPPTASTLGEAEGYSVVPESPEDATNVTPLCPAGVVNTLSYAVSPANSPAPQLIETTETPGKLGWRS